MRRKRQRGLTLVELVVAFTILIILTSMAVPLARAKVRAEKRRQLLYDLDDMRHAIDKYKDYCDQNIFGPPKQGTNCWPETLDQLVEGTKIASSADGKVIKLLRRIPKDPFTGTNEWGMRSDQDDPKSTSWGGQNVFDVYSKTDQKDTDGTQYSDW